MTPEHAQVTHAVDIRTTRPRLREGLRFVPQLGRDLTPWFRVEDPLCNRFHRIGLAEYEFLSALDGRRTIEQAREQAALSTDHRHVLEPERAESLVLWAVAESLVEGHHDSRQTHNHNSRSSLAWIKMPLVHGNEKWQPLVKATGWLFGLRMIFASSMLWIIALGVVLLNLDRFSQDVPAILSPSGWLTMASVWLVLKVVHELGHLVCCQRYGGRVGEVGVAWMLLAPVAYVDLTDLYRMKSRGGRLLTCLAGILVEMNVAALAVLAWSCTSAPLAAHLLATIAVTASLGSLLFNLNPLMRLDGYHALSDWLGRPNLGAESAKAMRSVASMIFLGRSYQRQGGDARLAIFGLAVFLYRIFVTGSLVIAANGMYGRIGLLVIASAIVIVAFPAFARTISETYGEFCSRPAALVRFLSTSMVLAVGLAAAWQVSGSWQSGWCGIVEYADDSPVRCASSGKVILVLVKSGQRVSAGEPLVELENRSLCAELAKAKCDFAAGEAKWKRLRETHLVAEAASEKKTNEALKTRLNHLQRQVDGLILRAPRSGTLIALEPDRWIGQWFDEGEGLLHVVDETKKKVMVAIPQDAIQAVRKLAGSPVRCRSGDGQLMDATITSIAQQAELSPPHPALAASAGGPLAVRPESDQDEVTLLSPHLRLEAAISDPRNRLFPGQPVRILKY